jgi:hypothetical protein
MQFGHSKIPRCLNPGSPISMCRKRLVLSHRNFGKSGRLVELCTFSEYLTTRIAVGVSSMKKSGALAGHRHNAEPLQVVLPDMPDSEITGKAIWALDEDRSNTPTGNSSQIIAISLRHGGLMWNAS